MPTYAVFGDALDSTIDFPELTPVESPRARWRFRLVGARGELREPVSLGAERIYGDVHAELIAHRDGHRIVVGDTGSFDLAPDGGISCTPLESAWPDFIRAHCLGRVLATALFLDGHLPLHGSGVQLGDGVVAFLAPKGFGKSSLALALAREGGAFVSDDTLPLELGPPVHAWPGVRAVRLRPDVATALGAKATHGTTREGKLLVDAASLGPVLERPAPLAAIYLLDPAPPDATGPISRIPLEPIIAAVAVVAHVKIGRMLGASAAAEMLDRVARIVHHVPVARLQVPRDLARLADVSAQLIAFHGRAP